MALTAASLWFRGADGALVGFDVRDAAPIDLSGAVHGAFAVVHGLGEHLGKYDEWTTHATARGFHVLRYDQRGHGRTPGRRGDYRFADLVEDLARVVEVTADRYAGAPVFLLGHSLGALVALRYAADGPHAAVRGAILTGPPLATLRERPGWQRWGVRALARLAPSFPLSRGARPGEHTRDAARAEAIARDRLIHGRISPRAAIETGRAIEEIRANPEAVRLPLLVLVAGRDAVVREPETTAYFRSVGSDDVTVERIPEALHEVLQEVGREATYERICTWCLERAGR